VPFDLRYVTLLRFGLLVVSVVRSFVLVALLLYVPFVVAGAFVTLLLLFCYVRYVTTLVRCYDSVLPHVLPFTFTLFYVRLFRSVRLPFTFRCVRVCVCSATVYVFVVYRSFGRCVCRLRLPSTFTLLRTFRFVALTFAFSSLHPLRLFVVVLPLFVCSLLLFVCCSSFDG